MNNESTLIIPQDYVRDVIKIIRFGTSSLKISDDLKEQLEGWCQEEERLQGMDFEWTDYDVIDFVNWYLSIQGFEDGRMHIENRTLLDSFKRGDDWREWRKK